MGQNVFENGLLNLMLKVPQETFCHTDIAIQEKTFVSWRFLIHLLTSTMDSVNKEKRLQLVMNPILKGYAHLN